VHKEGYATVSDFNYIVSGLTVCLYSYVELCIAAFELKMAKSVAPGFSILPWKDNIYCKQSGHFSPFMPLEYGLSMN